MELRAAFERALEARTNMLTKALEDPATVDCSKNQNGYVCLSGENANWHLCARVASAALKGRKHVKATSFVFELGQKVITAHGRQVGTYPHIWEVQP